MTPGEIILAVLVFMTFVTFLRARFFYQVGFEAANQEWLDTVQNANLYVKYDGRYFFGTEMVADQPPIEVEAWPGDEYPPVINGEYQR